MLQLLNVAHLVAAAAVAQTPAPMDDSVLINAGITAAIKAGKSEYVLPSGVINLRNPLYVPMGARNFTLRGASGDQTLIKTPIERLNYAIFVGENNLQMHNNWGITSRPTVSLQSVDAGTNSIVAEQDFKPTIGGYYVIWDQSRIYAYNNPNSSTILNHAEIVKVTGYDAATRTVKLDVPLGRSYGPAAALTDITPSLCLNVKVKDIAFDGLGLDGKTVSGGLVCAALSEGVTFSNLKVKNFIGWAATLANCRNSLVDNCEISDALAGGPGQGYGITATRSRFVKVQNSRSYRTRHGFVCHGGAMDISFTDCSSTSGSFDQHGMDERRMTYERCVGDGALSIGNGAWGAGDSDVTAKDCAFGGVELNWGAQRVRVSNTVVGILSILAYTSLPANDVIFTNCSLKATTNAIMENGAANNLAFVRCRLEATSTDWGGVFAVRGYYSQTTFDDCDFLASSTRTNDPMICIIGDAADSALSIRNSRFYGAVCPTTTQAYGTKMAVTLVPGLKGSYVFQNNKFYSSYTNKYLPNAKPTFLEQNGVVPKVNLNNLVIQTSNPRPGNQP